MHSKCNVEELCYWNIYWSLCLVRVKNWSLKKVMILSKKVMILCRLILVIWFEIFPRLHGKSQYSIKDNRFIARLAEPFAQRCSKKASLNFTYPLLLRSACCRVPASCTVTEKDIIEALSQRNLENFGQRNSYKRLLLKIKHERFLDLSKWKKK